MDVDSTSFRAVMSRFATGVTVATTCQGEQRIGITVNAFASVSLEPPLVLICLERASVVHEYFVKSGVFAVNMLSADQEDISTGFASNSPERFENFCGAASHPGAYRAVATRQFSSERTSENRVAAVEVPRRRSQILEREVGRTTTAVLRAVRKHQLSHDALPRGSRRTVRNAGRWP